MSHGRYKKGHTRVAFGMRGERGRRAMRARGRASRARRHPKGHIPLPVLEHRLEKLSRVVARRRRAGER